HRPGASGADADEGRSRANGLVAMSGLGRRESDANVRSIRSVVAATASTSAEPPARHVIPPKPTSKRRRVLLMLIELMSMVVTTYAIIASTDLFRGDAAGDQVELAAGIGGLFITALFSTGLYGREVVYNLISSTQRFITT